MVCSEDVCSKDDDRFDEEGGVGNFGEGAFCEVWGREEGRTSKLTKFTFREGSKVPLS